MKRAVIVLLFILAAASAAGLLFFFFTGFEKSSPIPSVSYSPGITELPTSSSAFGEQPDDFLLYSRQPEPGSTLTPVPRFVSFYSSVKAVNYSAKTVTSVPIDTRSDRASGAYTVITDLNKCVYSTLLIWEKSDLTGKFKEFLSNIKVGDRVYFMCDDKNFDKSNFTCGINFQTCLLQKRPVNP